MNSADAHLALAVIKLYHDYDYPGADREFRRALELNPSLPAARLHHGWCLCLFGRNQEALAQMKRGVEVDPLTPVYTAWVAWMYLILDDLDSTKAEADKALKIDPNLPAALYLTGCVYGSRKQYAEAIAVDQKLAAVDPNWRYALAEDYALSRRKDEALKLVADMEREDYARFSFFLFSVQTFLGNKEEAFRALQAAYDYRALDLPWVLQDESFPWRADPR